ncbi:MAG: class I SAM-dependent methyltransferase [Clostridia bacterium]|nr:class I SAM-dependent methyltransferase [Clostridia bacterium]
MRDKDMKESFGQCKIGSVIIDDRFYDGADTYNEGDAEEEFVLDVFREGKDVEEALRRDNRWPILYQLSPERKNIVLPMDLRSSDLVLEVGAGMGAITGALAKRAKHVDCIELSARRSLANAWRNKDCDNITIYTGNFQKMQLDGKYDVATLIGVLEYAPMFFHDEMFPDETMLNKLWGLLKPGGRLYIAIENRLGMKYFAGAVEDHFGSAYVGISGYPIAGAKTYSRAELHALLKKMGWDDIYFYYPYPDYKLPSVIYSDDMPNGDFIPAAVDYNQTRHENFDEHKAFLSMTQAEDYRTFANSFLVEAKKTV